MLPTYRATLRGDRIEWDDDAPDLGGTEQAVTVYVTIVTPRSEDDRERGGRMAEALRRIASTGGVASISDPAAWQREQREERDVANQP